MTATPQHIHLVAVCGTGMGSLAILLKTLGYHVTGSDLHVYPPMSTQLQQWGIPLHEGFRAAHLQPRPDLVIVGNAISRGNAEAEAAQDAGVPVMSFPQALAHFLIGERHGVVVAGTHGKSTTTALIAWLLDHAGLDPGYFVGAVTRNFPAPIRLGTGAQVVVEGDEYDSAYFDKGPKFLHYRPQTAVLTALEFDHADIYRDLEHVRSAFRRFVRLLPAEGCLLACGDDRGVRSLCEEEQIPARVETYGISGAVDWQAAPWQGGKRGAVLEVLHDGKPFGRFATTLFGAHNVRNALAAIAVAHRLGVTRDLIASGLRSFAGLKRRCEVRGEAAGVTVVDDFAHHPTAVGLTLQGLREAYPAARLWVLFEPRSATTRRRVFQSAYVDALSHADRVVIAEVYRKGELEKEERLSEDLLVEELNERGVPSWYYPDTADIIARVCAEAMHGDVAAIMSNGGFDNIHERLLRALRQKAEA
ncbi:MAG: UDP-N-acetylmuramate:L-alanyl-gamma-D-glutamyl-meso-diaminopimelate ligase [Candidatus Tectomicrobia bacterium]|nr:UDP-N-acetylmuramate:L-alanyl-gamma-D-glutamyl-meso-diaminopimelate ligase [Candidatus Tectomicrobia bacterium]